MKKHSFFSGFLNSWIDEYHEGTRYGLKGKIIIQKLIKGENVNIENSGLSKREWNELMIAFDLKDKLI